MDLSLVQAPRRLDYERRSHQELAVRALRRVERDAHEVETAETIGLALLAAQWSGYWYAKALHHAMVVEDMDRRRSDCPVARTRFRRRVEERLTAAWRRVDMVSDEHAADCTWQPETREVPCRQPQPS